MFKAIVLVCLIPFLLLLQTNYVATTDCESEPSSIEGKLLKKLLCSDQYDKTERPVRNHNTSVNVTMLMYLKEYYVMEQEPSVVMSAWLTISWMDEFLSWDRAEYGMEMVNVDSSELWRPTIETFQNKPGGILEKSCRDHQCEVKHNGNVSCLSPCSFDVHCVSTNVDWPFDVLDCSLFFSSWMEYAAQLNITAESNVSTQYLRAERSWKLLSAEVASRMIIDHDDYPFIRYEFIFERHMGMYAAIMTPGFMVVVVSLAVLWMNSASPERLYILSVTCLGHYIYLEYIYWHLAYNTKDVPKILLFFRDSLLINVLMLIFTIVLRHTAPGTNNSERLVGRLAVKVASTRFGCVLLQADRFHNPKQTQPCEENLTERENYRHAENGNGDTVTLVVDGFDSPGTTPVAVSGEQQRSDLVIIFIDRMMLLCCMICYLVMLFNLIPKKFL